MSIEEEAAICMCRMERYTEGLFNGLLTGPLEDTFVCFTHGRYHHCNGGSDCEYNGKGECVYSGYTVKLEKIYARDCPPNYKNAYEFRLTQLKNPYSFRDAVHSFVLERHGDVITVEHLYNKQMELIIAALYHYFSQNIDNCAGMQAGKKVRELDSLFTDICHRVAEVSINDHNAKQTILLRMTPATKANKSMRGAIAVIISRAMEGAFKKLEPLITEEEAERERREIIRQKE